MEQEVPSCPVVRTPCFHCFTAERQVQSLVGELRSHKPHSMAKKKKKTKQNFLKREGALVPRRRGTNGWTIRTAKEGDSTLIFRLLPSVCPILQGT